MPVKKVAIGIDLGTTKCCVGVVRDGKVEILENERSCKTTPSYVAFTDTERLLGEDAKDQATLNPINTIFGVKGIIGRGLEDSEVTKPTKEMPYTIVDNAGDPCINVTYQGREEMLLPQQLTAMLLTKMKDLAQNHISCSIEDAVISVPASFNNAQRQATKDAAAIAGLKVLALINEPTAAAIAYQANRKVEAEETIAIVDFGGGKLDVAIVSVNSACVSVKGVSGTTEMGGNDLDKILMAHIQAKFREKFPQDTPNDVAVLERLRAACVKLKNSLSLLPKAQDQLDCFGDKFLLPVSINRSKYEDMISTSIHHCLRTHLDSALQISGMNKQNISRVVLVGGSTRLPLVSDTILSYFDGCKLDRSVNPDEAVAQGAAIYAALLSGDNEITELTVEDMLPNSFSLAKQGCTEMKNIFPNCAIIPATNRLTVDEKTRCLKFELYEELSGRRDPHRLIGTLCVFDEFNKASCLATNVVFEIDQCGIFDVMIELGPSHDSSYIFRDVVRNYVGRLNAESLQNALAREQLFRQDEKEEKNRVDALTALESCCFRLLGEMETTKGKQHFPGLVEQIKAVAGETIDWLDTEVNVSKSDCQTKLKNLKKLERNLLGELAKLEWLEKERAAAERELRSCYSNVEAFMRNNDVTEEEDLANTVMRQVEKTNEWLQLETSHSKADCDEERALLQKLFGTLQQALEVRKQKKEREASVNELRTFCRKHQASVFNKLLVEADMHLGNEISDEATDTLQWLISNDKLPSNEECIKKRKSLEEKIKTLQRRAEKREQERAAELEKERVNLITYLWDRCHGLCSKLQTSAIEMYDPDLSKYILDQVAEVLAWYKEVGRNMSKTECDEALELVSNLGGLFTTWLEDREEKVLQQQLEKEQAEAAKRQEEQAEAAKKQEKQAEAAKRQEEQAEAAKRREEQAEAARRREEQAEAAKRQDKQAEAAKKQKEQAEAVNKVENEQAEADKKRKREQAEAAKILEKGKSTASKNFEKERTEALRSFENKWTILEATLSMDTLKIVEPDLVNQLMQSAEQTSCWLKTARCFCPDEYKKRLETFKNLGQDLQSRDEQLRADDADVGCGDSDIVMVDAKRESETEQDKSSCSLM